MYARRHLLGPSPRDGHLDGGIEVTKTPGAKFRNTVTVFLGGSGGIEPTIDDMGTPVVGSYGTSSVVSYP